MRQGQLKNLELEKINREYKREVTMVETQPKLRRLGLFMWLAIDVILIAVFIGYIGYYLTWGKVLERRQVSGMAENITSTHALSLARSAKPLSIDNTRVFSTEDSYYDFYAEVTNPNENWYALFNYYFVSSYGESQSGAGFIMPSETRPIVIFHQKYDRRPTNPELIITNVQWKRVDPRQVGDIASWLAEHNNFEISDVTYESDIQLGTKTIARSSFTIKNNTPYSYWTPEFFVILGRVGSPVAVNVVSVAGLEAGESRKVDINWFGSVPAAGNVTVIPKINFFDEEVYMPVSS